MPRTQFTITNEDLNFLIRKHQVKFRTAREAETRSPYGQRITWIIRGGIKYPYICETHSQRQINKLLFP